MSYENTKKYLAKDGTSLPSMNNIYLDHQGYEISIAQHRSGEETARNIVQEIMIWNVDQEDIIIRYSNTLGGLIDALNQVKRIIEKDEEVKCG